MYSNYIIITILLIALTCGVYSQRLNLSDKRNVSIQSLNQYNKWREQNKRNYLNSDEQLFRQLIFLENLSKVNQHNSNPDKTYTIDTNQFSDMSLEEFTSKILTYSENEDQINKLQVSENISFDDTNSPIATSIDWRAKGAVTAVKNQGKCGACWTFSTTGLMESYNFIKNGKLKTFSEQQIIDCAVPANGYSGKGCSGGNASIGLSYAQKYGAVESTAYPYVAAQSTCKVKTVTNGYKPTKYARLASTPEALKAALNKSPVSVAVDASLWHSYKSGVFNGCPEVVSVNHAVLAVGYDASGNWIVKNTWGASWGEKGYIRLAPGNTCGITKIMYTITA